MSANFIENEKLFEVKSSDKSEDLLSLVTSKAEHDIMNCVDNEINEVTTNVEVKKSGDEVKECPVTSKGETDLIMNTVDNNEINKVNTIFEGKDSDKLQKSDKQGLEQEPEKKDEWENILGSGAIFKKTIDDGQPDTHPVRSNKCIINYTCSLEDGSVVENEQNFEFFLGESDVSAKFKMLSTK